MAKNKILPYPELPAAGNKAKKIVVLLHGLGSDGHDLINLAPLMHKDLPDCHFISPHAVEPFDMAPYGRQWFSLSDRTPEVLKELVAKNIPMLAEIIKEKQQELGLSNKDTIIMGFSQGTMMGLYLTLIQHEPFAAMVAFSGRLIEPNHCLNNKTPVAIIHGQQDDVVDFNELYKITDYLTTHNIKHETCIIPDLAHSIDAKGLDFAIKFIKDSVQ